MDTCIYMIESLRCLPETITTLLIGYTPIQNKKLCVFFLFVFFLNMLRPVSAWAIKRVSD